MELELTKGVWENIIKKSGMDLALDSLEKFSGEDKLQNINLFLREIVDISYIFPPATIAQRYCIQENDRVSIARYPTNIDCEDENSPEQEYLEEEMEPQSPEDGEVLRGEAVEERYGVEEAERRREEDMEVSHEPAQKKMKGSHRATRELTPPASPGGEEPILSLINN